MVSLLARLPRTGPDGGDGAGPSRWRGRRSPRPRRCPRRARGPGAGRRRGLHPRSRRRARGSADRCCSPAGSGCSPRARTSRWPPGRSPRPAAADPGHRVGPGRRGPRRRPGRPDTGARTPRSGPPGSWSPRTSSSPPCWRSWPTARAPGSGLLRAVARAARCWPSRRPAGGSAGSPALVDAASTGCPARPARCCAACSPGCSPRWPSASPSWRSRWPPTPTGTPRVSGGLGGAGAGALGLLGLCVLLLPNAAARRPRAGRRPGLLGGQRHARLGARRDARAGARHCRCSRRCPTPRPCRCSPSPPRPCPCWPGWSPAGRWRAGSRPATAARSWPGWRRAHRVLLGVACGRRSSGPAGGSLGDGAPGRTSGRRRSRPGVAIAAQAGIAAGARGGGHPVAHRSR